MAKYDTPAFVTPTGGAVFVNPGSGPVHGDPCERHAYLNIRKLVKDTLLRRIVIERHASADDGEGRFGFKLIRKRAKGDLECIVEMPGIPIAEVRYLGAPQDIWDFPRLYVNGSSWVWKYAVNVIREDMGARA